MKLNFDRGRFYRLSAPLLYHVYSIKKSISILNESITYRIHFNILLRIYYAALVHYIYRILSISSYNYVYCRLMFNAIVIGKSFLIIKKNRINHIIINLIVSLYVALFVCLFVFFFQ